MRYGFCPHCFAEVQGRTRGGPNSHDTCQAGHVYPAAFTLPSLLLKDWAEMVRDTLTAVRDRLDEAVLMNGKTPLTERELIDFYHRCQRTLDAIPLVKREG